MSVPGAFRLPNKPVEAFALRQGTPQLVAGCLNRDKQPQNGINIFKNGMGNEQLVAGVGLHGFER
jgi:hypothetical protein